MRPVRLAASQRRRAQPARPERWAADGHLAGPELTVAGGRLTRPAIASSPSPRRRRPARHQPTGAGRRRRPGRCELVSRMDDGHESDSPAPSRGRSARLRLRPHRAPQPRRHRRCQPPVLRRRRPGTRLRVDVPCPPRAFVYVVADDVDQAMGDLAQDWANERRHVGRSTPAPPPRQSPSSTRPGDAQPVAGRHPRGSPPLRTRRPRRSHPARRHRRVSRCPPTARRP